MDVPFDGDRCFNDLIVLDIPNVYRFGKTGYFKAFGKKIESLDKNSCFGKS